MVNSAGNAPHPTVVKAQYRERTRCDFSSQNLRDQESADDEEYVDAGKPAPDRPAVVKGEHRKNSNGTQPIDVGAITGLS